MTRCPKHRARARPTSKLRVTCARKPPSAKIATVFLLPWRAMLGYLLKLSRRSVMRSTKLQRNGPYPEHCRACNTKLDPGRSYTSKVRHVHETIDDLLLSAVRGSVAG